MFTKVLLFFWLLVKTKLRARTSFLASLSLANYSEFGLIVGAIGVNNGWMSQFWLITIAIALAITFVIASPLNANAHSLYSRYTNRLKRWQLVNRLTDELPVDVSNSSVLVFGMGRIGTGVYKDLSYYYPEKVTGIDFDSSILKKHEIDNRKVIYADVMDKDFWGKIELADISMIFLNLPDFDKNLFTITQLKEKQYQGYISVIAMYDEEVDLLKKAGANAVYNFYSEAGIGFAEYTRVKRKKQ
jgi:glutathione-regulated potassium-efflux system ancillary protein KefC